MNVGKKELWIEKRYVTIPVWTNEPLQKLEVFCEEVDGRRKIFEFRIPQVSEGSQREKSYDARLDVEVFAGKKLIFEGAFPDTFFGKIQNVDAVESDGKSSDAEYRPEVHFTPKNGWMNDPNGLVYQDGTYHMYFQHNPFDINWENMCWGHAVSTDLLHWEQQDTVLFPDEHGTIFSGSGVVNEKGLLGLPRDALVFFYTAAGNCNDWAVGRNFTQRLAYSRDGGKTFTKSDLGEVETISWENRDPKVFWHEESRAYIMVLWIEGNTFGRNCWMPI